MFERLAKVGRSTVERVHGKVITVFPISRIDVNAAPRQSATEDAYQTVGCFYENTMIESEAKAQPMTGSGGRLMHRSLVRTASIRLIPGKPFATNFIVRREDDQALFTVTQFDPDGMGNVLANLSVAQSLPEA